MPHKEGEERREYKRQYYLKHREYIREKQNRKYYENREERKKYYTSREVLDRRKELRDADPRRQLLSGAKRRAREKGLGFDIDVDDIKIPSKCPIFDIPIEVGNGKSTPNSPSIDRIDNSKGYIKGNVAVISWKANKMKSSMSLQDIERLYHWVNSMIDPTTGQPTCS